MIRAGLFTLTLVLAGCGSAYVQDGRRDAPREPEVGSARVSISYDYPAADAAGSAGLSAEGIVDFRNDRRRIVTNLPVTTEKHPDPMSFELDLYLETSEQITIGPVTYLHIPGLGPKEKPWHRAQPSESSLFAFDQLVLADPVRAVELLRSTSDDLTEAPGLRVRGVKTTAYRGRLNVEKLGDQAAPNERELLGEWIDGLTEGQTMSFEALLDADAFPRRVRLIERGEMTTTIEFFDLGVREPIEPPPAERVMTDEELSAWIKANAGAE